MNKKDIVIVCLTGLLIATVVVALHDRKADDDYVRSLEEEVALLHQKEKQSAVDRRVSKQMEEIAYGQQALSEERSLEAIRQSKIAQEMTLRSEAERKNALRAQAAAEASEHEARQAFLMAERQRQIADDQRREALHAKQVADTLNYISLGRTLGSLSYSIFQAGDTDLGNMLAYTSYLFTEENGGDLYSSSVFPALTQSAQSKQGWNLYKGSVSRILFLPTQELVGVTTYGEIFVHRQKSHDSSLNTQSIFRDNRYCFRDAVITNSGKVYAVSHTGHLAVCSQCTMPNAPLGRRTLATSGTQECTIIPLENISKPFSLQLTADNRQLLVVGEQEIGLLDVNTDRLTDTRRLSFKVTSTGQRDGRPLLFDTKGGMHLFIDIDNLTTEKVPVAGNITAFASSKDDGLAAYGTADGTIYVTDGNGNVIKLVGHLSQVTRMRFDGPRLYSSSYDSKLLFWIIGDGKAKPITLFQSNSWLTDFTFDNQKDNIWTGEANGTLTEYLISLPLIRQRIRKNLKRNFTEQEWDYYVGKGIPYREVKN